MLPSSSSFFFFFNDTATTEIYTLSLHVALPIWPAETRWHDHRGHFRKYRHGTGAGGGGARLQMRVDRKSTRLNSSHSQISYAVFCLKKKKNQTRSPSKQNICHRASLVHLRV